MTAVGTTLGGKYRLERELGSGAMGSVWRAHNLQLEAPVAIKLMNTDISRDPTALARFQKEAHAGALVRSPYVLSVFDHAVDPQTGQAYIVMELLDGESLGSRLENVGRLTPEQTFRIVGQVCQGLTAAHERGIVHRDLKPDNVFLSGEEPDQIAKILDFGIAKTPTFTAGPGTQTGVLLGTPYYMSPEQIRGASSADTRSDLWSLAVIAFQCLSGQRPFQGETIGGLALAICAEPIPSPSTVAAHLRGFDAFFERALQRAPDDRFQSAKEFASGLRAACEGGSTTAARGARRDARPLHRPDVHPTPHAVASARARGGGFDGALAAAPMPQVRQSVEAWSDRGSQLRQASPGSSHTNLTPASVSEGTPSPSASPVRHHQSPLLRRGGAEPTRSTGGFWLLGLVSLLTLGGAGYWGWRSWGAQNPVGWLVLIGSWLLLTAVAILWTRKAEAGPRALRAGDLAKRLRLRVAQGRPSTDLASPRDGDLRVLLDGQVSGMPMQLHFERYEGALQCELRAKLRAEFRHFEVVHRKLPTEPELGLPELATGNPSVDSNYRVFTTDAELARRLGSALDGFYSFQDVGVHLIGYSPLVRYVMHGEGAPDFRRALSRAERLSQALVSLADSIHPQARNTFADS